MRNSFEDAADVIARALDASPLGDFELVVAEICYRPSNGGVCPNCVSDERLDAEGVAMTVWRCRAAQA